MPSHTAASALIKFYYLEGHPPWCWSKWQDRTGIRHGLFPEDDAKLPEGWSRQDANDVFSYFEAYNRLPTEDAKIKFATRTQGNTHHPGREIWLDFVKEQWAGWRVHDAVITELREWGCHPKSIVRRDRIPPGSWPDATAYISKILDTLAMRLFGDEAFVDGSEIFAFEPRKALTIFAQRSWNNVRSQVGYMRNQESAKEQAAVTAFQALEIEPLTKAKVSHAIQTVATWREHAEISHIDEHVKKAKDMLANLETVMEGLGAKIVKRKAVKPRKVHCKVSRRALQTLATQEDVTDLLNIYHDYFQLHVDDDDDEISILYPEQDDRVIDDCSTDLGTEVEATMPPAVLLFELGFRNSLPSQFNAYRHRHGLTPWEYPNLFTTTPISPDISKLELHWHQLAGVHSIVRSVFSEKKDISHTAGVLISDGVGLGKTGQSCAFIAFLNQTIMMMEEQHKLPRVFDERPYLWGQKKIPSQPHLIICPGTLINQWVSELKTFFRPKSVDIFIYDSQTDGAAFWALQDRSRAPIRECMIELLSQVTQTHKQLERRKSRPWIIPDAKKSLNETLFAQYFLTIVVDEAHSMRNAGNKHVATLRLLQQARIRLIMTATPLHTSLKDIAAMGRLVGISHFFEEESHEDERATDAVIRRAKKLDDPALLQAEQLKAVKRLQKHLFGHFLRRTSDSVDWKNRTLLPLPPYHEIKGVLDLTDRELAIIDERAEDAKAAILSASDSTRIHTKKFYLEYRTAVGYAKEDLAEPWPIFKSLQEWEPKKSTKMDACARICKHYLTRDDAPDISFTDGAVQIPDLSQTPLHGIQQTRRIIIYSEFSSMAPLFRSVLELYGVKSLAINGHVSMRERDKRVKRFYDNKCPARVLLFSSVGSAGLNLSIADVVIFFDQPWSSQDEIQIRGRAHRQPQKKNVKVIYLRANGSADLLVSGMAGGKANMFDAFVNKELGQELEQLIQGSIPDLDETQSALAQEVSEQEAGSTKARPKSKGKKKSKSKAAVKPQDRVAADNSDINKDHEPVAEATTTAQVRDKPKAKLPRNGKKKSGKGQPKGDTDNIGSVDNVEPKARKKHQRRRVIVEDKEEPEKTPAAIEEPVSVIGDASTSTIDTHLIPSSRSVSVASIHSSVAPSSSHASVHSSSHDERDPAPMVDYSSSSSDNDAGKTSLIANHDLLPQVGNHSSSHDVRQTMRDDRLLPSAPQPPNMSKLPPQLSNIINALSSSSDEAPPLKKVRPDAYILGRSPSPMVVEETPSPVPAIEVTTVPVVEVDIQDFDIRSPSPSPMIDVASIPSPVRHETSGIATRDRHRWSSQGVLNAATTAPRPFLASRPSTTAPPSVTQGSSQHRGFRPPTIGTPSRNAGSLDDVTIPDASALVGHRNRKRKSKK
ncbi:hypothetical protein D9756_002852 [Leucocoprinus leucothites]|uniref:Uncharacterized protein n=1 Tax=Leucocoprinus leucothites TaxID=201217 RepID=A0A8H5GCB7_9AGAR|nr:hypothetical protein D9756_002852 [Leucoagaricus leucothites]